MVLVVTDLSAQFDVYGDIGITVPPRHLKRKLRDVDVDESAVMSRRCGVGRGVPGDRFSGARWSEPQRRWDGFF